MGGICITIQGLWHLQSRTSHQHARKIWRPPKTTLSDQTHVRQKYIQTHHQKGGDIHRIKSGRQTRRQHEPGTISILNDWLRQNSRRWVDGPRTKQIPICVQRQLTKINRTIGKPPTRHLLVWNTFGSILHDLYRRRHIKKKYRTDIKKGITLLYDHFARFGLEMHIGTKKNPSNIECVFSLFQVSLKHEQWC